MKCFYSDDCKLEDTSECGTQCIRYSEISFLLKTSKIPEKKCAFKNLELINRDKEAYKLLDEIINDMKNFVNNGENLIIYSMNSGNGKTEWAIQLMLSYFDDIWAGNGFRKRGYFIHVPTFLLQWKEFKDDESFKELKDTINTIDLLILDDFGIGKITEFDLNVLGSIISQRMLNEKSTIITTNYNKSALQEIVGMSIVNKIWNNSSVVNFVSDGYRSGR